MNDLKPISNEYEESLDQSLQSSSKDPITNSNDSTEVDGNPETIRLKKELEEMTQKLIETKLQAAELAIDVVQEKKKTSEMEKLLVSQSSTCSDIDQTPTKKSSKWNICCCASDNSVVLMNNNNEDEDGGETTKIKPQHIPQVDIPESNSL